MDFQQDLGKFLENWESGQEVNGVSMTDKGNAYNLAIFTLAVEIAKTGSEVLPPLEGKDPIVEYAKQEHMEIWIEHGMKIADVCSPWLGQVTPQMIGHACTIAFDMLYVGAIWERNVQYGKMVCFRKSKDIVSDASKELESKGENSKTS